MTEEYMCEVEKIKEELKERLKSDIPAPWERLYFFNHFLRFYGDTKTPRELLALAVERDESLYFREHGESVAEMYRRTENEDVDVLSYTSRNRDHMGDYPSEIVIFALGSCLDRCRSQAEKDFYMSKPPLELLAFFREDQVDVYGEEALSDPRWNKEFWDRSSH